MRGVLAIARNTFKEAIRNRVLYIILIFALMMIALSRVAGELTIESRERIVKDLGFAAINLFGVAIAVFVGVSLVFNELEKRTIYTIVSKPISRWQFLLGKYFGLLVTIYANVLVMTLFFLFMVHYDAADSATTTLIGAVFGSMGKAVVALFVWNAYPATVNIMPVIMATAIELAMVTGFAILFSSFTTPTLSMFFTVLTFVAGRLNEDIVGFAVYLIRQAAEIGAGPPLAYYVTVGVALIMPNLGLFHGTVDQALYADEVVISFASIIYAFCYTAGVLSLAMLIFSRRNFK